MPRATSISKNGAPSAPVKPSGKSTAGPFPWPVLELDMRDFVQRQTTDLLAKLSAEIERAAGDRDPDAIHDLRVAIRRLSRCLRVFSQFYPGRSWKKARAQLSELMHAAGAVRDRDIALEL